MLLLKNQYHATYSYTETKNPYTYKELPLHTHVKNTSMGIKTNFDTKQIRLQYKSKYAVIMLDNVHCPIMHTHATVEVNDLIINNSKYQLYEISLLEINVPVITRNFQVITNIKAQNIPLGGNKCGAVDKTKILLVILLTRAVVNCSTPGYSPSHNI